MFGINTSLADLDATQRTLLLALLRKKRQYMQSALTHMELQEKYLENPTPANLIEAENYASMVLRPQKSEINGTLTSVLQNAVDLEGIKRLLPLVLAGVLQSVNLPLLLAAANIDAEEAEQLMKMIKRYIQEA